jgi:hypothetical protein
MREVGALRRRTSSTSCSTWSSAARRSSLRDTAGRWRALCRHNKPTVVTRHGRHMAHPGARGEAEARFLRVGRVEILPGPRPAVSLVLDSSAALAWIYAEETTDAVRQIFESVAEHGAHVPALWRLEVANSLTLAVRRGRIDVAFRNAALSAYRRLRLDDDPASCRPVPRGRRIWQSAGFAGGLQCRGDRATPRVPASRRPYPIEPVARAA